MINRRELTCTGVAAALWAASGARAQGGPTPVEGKDYVRLPSPAPVAAPAGKFEVVEFFSYGCPHCYAFEPLLEPWIKKLPADVAFRRVPAAFNAAWEGLAKIFYALEATDQVEAMHKRVFAAIHVQRQRLDKEADIAAFIKSGGGDEAKFLDAYKSFSVATKLRQGKQLAEAYKIDGVPTIGVHGRWFTSGSLAGSHERALAVVDQLLQRARKPN